ncbi:hypothetical protein [Actinomycetospora termitidis]|uniref:Uncharacterized protein n=1 Tax=Actinomycetospora termitidis TaxID=3053470 RepID=A0ABT7MG24_9PSEU|nr:hypothetical protein [Actinomycetospora sp. Odt1-22]MDL5159625.1 hypothetical protein [Actinomycetospora sp. Odt1-22]
MIAAERARLPSLRGTGLDSLAVERQHQGLVDLVTRAAAAPLSADGEQEAPFSSSPQPPGSTLGRPKLKEDLPASETLLGVSHPADGDLRPPVSRGVSGRSSD